MIDRYRLMRRASPGGRYYAVDTETGKRTSLNTSDLRAAKQLLFSKDQADPIIVPLRSTGLLALTTPAGANTQDNAANFIEITPW